MRRDELQESDPVFGEVAQVERAPTPDWETLQDRAVAETEEQARSLTDRIVAELEKLLAEMGETRSPEQWKGLKWGADVIARKAYRIAPPNFYALPLDTGVGKTLLLVAAIRVILADPALAHVGMVVFINRRELADALVERIGIAKDDPRLSVYFSQREENLRWNALGVGLDMRPAGTRKRLKSRRLEDGTKETCDNPSYLAPPQNEAQLLITTQGLLKSRSRWGPNFEKNDLWFFRNEPRALRLWDEASPPAQGITLTVGQITAYANTLPAELQTELLKFADLMLNTDNDTALLVPA